MTPLRVSHSKRYLVRASGEPFLWLGDTAWELFHRLSREEADFYLTTRARQRFTVIQAVALAEFDGLHLPNAYGEVPLEDDDPARPREAYFKHVDWIVRRANELGLVMGFLPTWGDKVGPEVWGVGPEVFNPEKALAYGRFLGARYKDADLVWILGGDRGVETPEQLAIWRALAQGLAEGDGGIHLMTYHPWGGRSSSEYVGGEAWLDINMLQSGHGARDIANWQMVQRDYNLTPAKPTLDGEPRYEDHAVNWDANNGYFDEVDVRQGLYWGLLAGGCGITYGCHPIWQFWQPPMEPVTQARTPWRQALELPGANQIRHLRALYESRGFLKLAPDNSIIAEGQGEGADHVQAARDLDGRFLYAYVPTGKALSVRTEVLSGTRIKAEWFDPRTGERADIGSWPASDTRAFEPPTSGRGSDWVLVVERA